MPGRIQAAMARCPAGHRAGPCGPCRIFATAGHRGRKGVQPRQWPCSEAGESGHPKPRRTRQAVEEFLRGLLPRLLILKETQR